MYDHFFEYVGVIYHDSVFTALVAGFSDPLFIIKSNPMLLNCQSKDLFTTLKPELVRMRNNHHPGRIQSKHVETMW